MTSDTDTEVRIVVCQALVMCVEANIDVLMESLQGIVEFMLHCSQDKDELVAREACEFWLVFTEMSVERFDLVPLLPRYLHFFCFFKRATVFYGIEKINFNTDYYPSYCEIWYTRKWT